MPNSVQIMAILNVTPDSFSDGGRFSGTDAVLQAAEASLNAGASILDIGGESTRPGALEVPVDEELKRVVPVVEAIQEHFPEAVISVDTRKSKVAAAAIQAGAMIINDVSGFQFDETLLPVVASSQAQLVLMHSQGTPQTMQNAPDYPEGVVPSVMKFFQQQMQLGESAGLYKERIILDPGFGFGKTAAHNLALLKHLDVFQTLECPILVGLSRKSFLTLGKDIPPQERDTLSAAAMTLAIERGARYIRVHNVKEQREVRDFLEAFGAVL